MWEEGGRAYIYFCYGMHHMLNVVTGREGEAAAVLIRACEPLEGLERIRERRSNLEGPSLLTGPGKVAQALGLDRTFNHHILFEAGGLELRRSKAPERILAGPRVGIAFANPEDRAARLRFAAAGSRWVTHLRQLDTL
jgi:DNA-3-methyladenine glycosylase